MRVEGEKPSLAELAHYGVRGMKWGVRRAEEPTHPSYTARMQANDRTVHGKRAVQRINARLNQGQSHKKALEREEVRNSRQTLVATGAVVVASLLAQHGSTSVADLRGQAPKRKTISSAAAKTPYVKPRRGVHKITTMK